MTTRIPTAAASKGLQRQPHQYLPETRVWYYPLLVQDGGYVDPVWNMFIPTQAVFPTAVPIPEMPGKTRPTKGFLMGTVADFAGNTYDVLDVTITGPETRVVKTDGFGWFGAADLLPGHYQITIGKEDFVGRRLINAWVEPGGSPRPTSSSSGRKASRAGVTLIWRSARPNRSLILTPAEGRLPE